MNKREFLKWIGAGAALAAVNPVMAAEAWIEELNTYFNSVRTAFAPFSQVNPNGSKVTGKFYLYKPGKMRFEYDDKKYPLIIADGHQLAIFDPKSNQGAQKYPQGQTPVSLLARDDINLTSSKFVRKIDQNRSSGEALITLADPDRPNLGSLIVRVDTKRKTMKGWQSIDKASNRTTVNLQSFNTGLEMNKNLFSIRAAEKARGIER